jgi:hypothetical protein
MPGRFIRLSPGRRFIADLSWLARSVPQGVVRRDISIVAVRSARAGLARPPPWTVVFAKAWALAARDVPDLRRTYAAIPWPHLYEIEHSVASVMVERDWHGETALVAAKLKRPEDRSLADLAAEVAHAIDAPIDGHRHFRSMLTANRMPLLVRRALWWYMFNTGPQRHKFFGTFGITALGHRGVSINYPVSPATTVVTLGPFRTDGTVEATIGFDHRTMDGAAVADALDALQRHLDGAIAAELGGPPAEPLMA